MIELPICCMDIRKIPPEPLTIAYETDFMLPPQKQTLELHGQGLMCPDCSIVWEIKSGPGILIPNFGPRVVFEIPKGQLPTFMNGLGRTHIDLYCMDQHLQTLEIWSQCWAYNIFEDWEMEKHNCFPWGLEPPPMCSAGAIAHVHRYNCFGKLVRSSFARHWVINREVEDCDMCPAILEEVKEFILKHMIEKRGLPWKVPEDLRTQRAIELGCGGYYVEPDYVPVLIVEIPEEE